LSFSALQRAENSSIRCALVAARVGQPFQCSSASRKFLNASAGRDDGTCERVSVLFSEPKIPQFLQKLRSTAQPRRFSALQRAENSSIIQQRMLTVCC